MEQVKPLGEVRNSVNLSVNIGKSPNSQKRLYNNKLLHQRNNLLKDLVEL